MAHLCRSCLSVVEVALLLMLAVVQAFAATKAYGFDPTTQRIRPDGSQGQTAASAAAVRLAAGSTLYIPASAHLSGAVGTNWRTDLELHNPGVSDVSITVALLERDHDNSSPRSTTISVGAGRSARYDDVLQSLFSFSGAAALRLTTSGGDPLVTSRTFNDQPQGTYGQLVPAFAESEAFTRQDPAYLIQLSQSTSETQGFRTNIGLLNLSEGTLLMKVRLFDSGGTELGTVTTWLDPYEFEQLDKIFRRVTSQEVSDGYAVVEAQFTGGSERFLAYASVIDNRTGDPVFLPALRTPAGGSLVIPAAAHVTGAGGTSWRTDLELLNPGPAQCAYTIELLARDQDNSLPDSRSFQLDPGLAVRYKDVLASMFAFSGAAALRVTPSGCPLQLSSRTYNETADGTYGQLVPGRATAAAIPAGVAVRLIQLRESTASSTGFRTNIGIVNATAAPLQIAVDLYDGSGNLLGRVPSSRTALRALEFRQLDRVFRTVTSAAVEDGYAVLTTNTSAGAFFAYASVIDNRTGDPVFMPELQPAGALTVTRQFEEVSYYLRDVDMLSSTTGWAVGEAHWDPAEKQYVTTLLKTDDGGASWSEHAVGQTAGLNAVVFVGQNNGWAVGGGGLILHTSNGGGSWTRQTIATTDGLRAVSFPDDEHGWITAVRPTHWDFVGDEDNWEASVWHTDDGGQTWNEQSLPAGASILHGVQFIDTKTGWAVGARYVGDDPWPEHRMVVYHTTDGGATWAEQYAPDLPVSLTDVDFVDVEHGWAVGFVTSSGEIGGATFHTTDGGSTWERQDPGHFFDLLWDVEAIDANRAYIMGANYIAAWGPPVFRTVDGGTTWEKVIQERHDSEGLFGLALTGDRAIAVGDHDYVVRSEDAWGEYGWPHGDNLFKQAYISAHYKLEDVFFIDQYNGWAVGRRAFAPELWGQVILHTSDGGASWAEQYEKAPPMDNLFSYFRLDAVSFVDALHGWATGSSETFYEAGWKSHGAILHTSDGGLHWEEQGQELADGLAPELFDVQFLDGQHGWALDKGHYDDTSGGQSLFLAKTEDGGAHWAWVPTGIEGGLAIGFAIVQGGLHFADSQNGWAVGGLGTIIHTADGGNSWEQQALDCGYASCPWHLMHVIFTSSSEGWIAGEGGFFHTLDGGTTWTARGVGVSGDLHDVAFPTAANGWAVGDRGTIVHSGDGGASWSSVASPTGLSLLGLHCVRSSLCWAVGDFGEILRIGGN
jgi:photosystem II stability/assembly factor-like uncharacterized protein